MFTTLAKNGQNCDNAAVGLVCDCGHGERMMARVGSRPTLCVLTGQESPPGLVKMAAGPPLSEVEARVEELLTAWGYELVLLRFFRSGPRGRLWLVIDKPGGVNLTDCAKVYERIGDYLDVLDPIPGSYVLEVSSPGVDRLLTKERHFAETVGKRVRVKLRRAGRKRKSVVTGTLVKFENGQLEIETEGKVETLNREDVDEARAIHEWD